MFHNLKSVFTPENLKSISSVVAYFAGLVGASGFVNPDMDPAAQITCGIVGIILFFIRER